MHLEYLSSVTKREEAVTIKWVDLKKIKHDRPLAWPRKKIEEASEIKTDHNMGDHMPTNWKTKGECKDIQPMRTDQEDIWYKA